MKILKYVSVLLISLATICCNNKVKIEEQTNSTLSKFLKNIEDYSVSLEDAGALVIVDKSQYNNNLLHTRASGGRKLYKISDNIAVTDLNEDNLVEVVFTITNKEVGEDGEEIITQEDVDLVIDRVDIVDDLIFMQFNYTRHFDESYDDNISVYRTGELSYSYPAVAIVCNKKTGKLYLLPQFYYDKYADGNEPVKVKIDSQYNCISNNFKVYVDDNDCLVIEKYVNNPKLNEDIRIIKDKYKNIYGLNNLIPTGEIAGSVMLIEDTEHTCVTNGYVGKLVDKKVRSACCVKHAAEYGDSAYCDKTIKILKVYDEDRKLVDFPDGEVAFGSDLYKSWFKTNFKGTVFDVCVNYLNTLNRQSELDEISWYSGDINANIYYDKDVKRFRGFVLKNGSKNNFACLNFLDKYADYCEIRRMDPIKDGDYVIVRDNDIIFGHIDWPEGYRLKDAYINDTHHGNRRIAFKSGINDLILVKETANATLKLKLVCDWAKGEMSFEPYSQQEYASFEPIVVKPLN